MANEAQPRLAVILHADVVGSTTLVRQDERLAHQRIQTTFRDVASFVERYGGTVNEVRGDAIVAEFARASDAVLAALAAQEANRERFARLEDGVAPVLRMGIALGEVVIADATVTGAGVVLAQRLEQFAEPGGTCVSGAVREAVPDRLALRFESMGAREVKGFDEPVSAYSVCMPEGTPVPPPQPSGATRTPAEGRRGRWLVVGGATALLIAAAVVWFAPWWPGVEPTPVERTASLVTGKPSIAVLPFVNMSDDKEQEYFSDGMTEDLITDLSKISSLSVISRTSTSGYKGRTIDVREVGAALGVRYVVEGSVRKTGSQVRINAQLIDVISGSHIWADRYDGDLMDIFALQDKVLEKIVGAMALTLSKEERRRIAFRGTNNVIAHDLYLKGLFEESKFSREGNSEAVRLYKQALSIDPDYPLPYARLSNILQLSPGSGWSGDFQDDLEEAIRLAEKAVALDNQNPTLHWMLSRAIARVRAPDAMKRSIESMERAIVLDPDFADAYAFLGNLYTTDHRIEDGLRSIETAMQMNPQYPFWYLFMRGVNRFMAEDYENAIIDFETAAERSPTAQFVRWWLAASYAQAGRQDDAEWQVEELFDLGFEGSISTITQNWPNWPAPLMKRKNEALRKAGIPE